MKWIEPKTNWSIRIDQEKNYLGDYFEAEDYLRIRNNLYCLQELAEELGYLKNSVEIPLVTRQDFCSHEHINTLEKVLSQLRVGTLSDLIQKTKLWKENQPAPVAEDWNRIETSCLIVWRVFHRQKKSARRLPLRLGGGIF